MSEPKDKAPKLHSFWEETEGGFSMNRLCASIWISVFCFCLVYSLVTGKPLPTIEQGWLWVTGIYVTGGAACKGIEVVSAIKSPNSSPSPTPPAPPAA